MTAKAFLSRIGIEHPILLAPMAGSGGTPELAAAVSNAGGLGAWGGAYAKPDEIAAAIRRIRQLTSRPFNINLFAGGYASDPKVCLLYTSSNRIRRLRWSGFLRSALT